MMKLVIMESPFAGDVDGNILYARAAVRDSLQRGEAPIASHLLYTQEGILNDEIPLEREQGINAGLAWGKVAEATVVYVDRGISRGMEYGIKNAVLANRLISYRSLPEFSQHKEVVKIADLSVGDKFFAFEGSWVGVVLSKNEVRAIHFNVPLKDLDELSVFKL